jgi:hypothetical protein
MQVFVRRSSLASDEVIVLYCLDDAIQITPEMQAPDSTVLSLGPNAIQTSMHGTRLKAGWREANAARLLRGEAERRILAVFPEHAQRNAAIELGLMAGQQGDNAWLKRAQQRRTEIERVFAYVNAVRLAAQRLTGALPSDPTADSHWPARAAAYKAD